LNWDLEGNVFGVEDLAVLGLNPKCGCPMAIDMSSSSDAVRDFESSGLLIQFMPPSAAQEMWDKASWPCDHESLAPSQTASPNESLLPPPALRLME